VASPALRPEAELVEAAKRAAIAAGMGGILVVEDQEDLRGVLSTLRVLGPVCESAFAAPC
jgi:hypothetical protein